MSGRREKVCSYCRGLRAVIFEVWRRISAIPSLELESRALVGREVSACPYCG